MKIFSFIAVLFLLAVPPLRAAEFQPIDHLITGKATYIVDGDTLDVGETRIRLWGIDTPERKEPGYKDAKDYLKNITANATLNCMALYFDHWKRTVASCEIHGQDVGRMMVLSGMAKDYVSYSNGFYAKDEVAAREANRGFWHAK